MQIIHSTFGRFRMKRVTFMIIIILSPICFASKPAYAPVAQQAVAIAPPPPYQPQPHEIPIFVDEAAMQEKNKNNLVISLVQAALTRIYTDSSIKQTMQARYPNLKDAQVLEHARTQKEADMQTELAQIVKSHYPQWNLEQITASVKKQQENFFYQQRIASAETLCCEFHPRAFCYKNYVSGNQWAFDEPKCSRQKCSIQ